MTLTRVALASVLWMLAGCALFAAPDPTEDQVAAANIGDPPSAEAAEAKVRAYLDSVLKDPGSLRLNMGAIERGWYRVARTAPPKFAWLCLCGVNARNSYGGYTGEQPYHFYFLGDNIVALGHQATGFSTYGRYTYMTVSEAGGGGLTAKQAGLQPSKSESKETPEKPDSVP